MNKNKLKSLLYIVVLLSQISYAARVDSPRLLPYYRGQDCGPVSLSVVFALRGIDVSLDELYATIPISNKGTNAASLISEAEKHGLGAKGVKCDIEQFLKANTLSIIEFGKKHFAVFVGVNPRNRDELLIVDLPKAPRYVSKKEFCDKWTEMAIMFPLSKQKTKSSSKPMIKVTPTVNDLGEVWLGDTVDCKFKIENTGSDILRISDVRASCGCTIPSLKKKVLKPGQVTNMSVVFKSEVDLQKSQETNKAVSILTNCEEGITHVGIKVKLKPRYVVTPSNISVSGSSDSILDDMKREFAIEFIDSTSTQISNISESAKWMSVKELPGRKNEKGSNVKYFEMSLKSIPKLSGTIVENIYVSTNSIRYPKINIPICFEILGEYEVLPQKIYLGVKKPGSKIQKQITIRKQFNKEPFSVKEIKSDNLAISFQPPTKSGIQQSFDLQVSLPDITGKLKSSIRIELDNGNSIILPVFGFLRDK